MAPRLEHNENIVFLFKCIESTNIKVDFQKVSATLGIKRNAARMRYVRLRRAVESSLRTPNDTNTVAASKGKNAAASKISRKPVAGSKRKVTLDDHDIVESDAEHEFIASSTKQHGNQRIGRQTRGIKLDFSEAFADLNSQSEHEYNSDSDDQSEFLEQQSVTPDHEANGQMKGTITPLKNIKATGQPPLTPPRSKKPTRRVTTSLGSPLNPKRAKDQSLAKSHIHKPAVLPASTTPPETPKRDDTAVKSLTVASQSPLEPKIKPQTKLPRKTTTNHQASAQSRSTINSDHRCSTPTADLDPQTTLSLFEPGKKLSATMYKRRKIQAPTSKISTRDTQTSTPQPLVAPTSSFTDNANFSDNASSLMTHNGIFPKSEHASDDDDNSTVISDDIIYPEESISMVENDRDNNEKTPNEPVKKQQKNNFAGEGQIEEGGGGGGDADINRSFLHRLSSFWK